MENNQIVEGKKRVRFYDLIFIIFFSLFLIVLFVAYKVPNDYLIPHLNYLWRLFLFAIVIELVCFLIFSFSMIGHMFKRGHYIWAILSILGFVASFYEIIIPIAFYFFILRKQLIEGMI